MVYYVYILTNYSKSSLYIAITNNIHRRMYEHKNRSFTGFTKKYQINILVFAEEFSSAYDAIENEKRLKGWSRKKKNQLIEQSNPKWKDLSANL